MKFIFKTIALILIFFISLMIFLPKIELFNLVEKELEKRNIVISNEIKKKNYLELILITLRYIMMVLIQPLSKVWI